MRPLSLILTSLVALGTLSQIRAVDDGASLYQQHCALCHGQQGAGITAVFPPLAGSDFFVKERNKTLRAPMEGLFGKIEVNGTAYLGAMPPVLLDDAQLATVFNYVFTAWGNQNQLTTAEEIAALRAKTRFPTLEKLKSSMVGTQLPTAPAGWDLKVGAELAFSALRLALHPDGKSVLALSMKGNVWSWNPDGSEVVPLFEGASYLDASLGEPTVSGMAVDKEKRLYLTSNQRHDALNPVRNEVTIFRTEPWTPEKGFGRPVPWLKTSYNFGVGPYNHGVSHTAFGPDGMLYVNSGSRTDGGEPGKLPNYATTGEEHLTASIWRLNPKDENPTIEIYARGLRNTFGFCWDSEGRLIGSENGPDAHPAEELNIIEQGKHYGFPYQFSDWKDKPYPYTPDAPEGLTFTFPFKNVGPDAGGGSEKGLYTFDPHSCPSGIVWLEPDWPAPLGGSFLVSRFGNLIKLDPDVGFDVLQVRPNYEDKTVTVNRLLAPLGRPIDVLKLPGHRVVIAEYTRGTNLAAGTGTPGRLLLLTPRK